MPIPMTPDERAEKAARLKGRGWAAPKIAEHLGVSLTTIKRDLKKVGPVDPQLPDGLPEAGRAEPTISKAKPTFDPSRQGDPNAALAARGVAPEMPPVDVGLGVDELAVPADAPEVTIDTGLVDTAVAGAAALGVTDEAAPIPIAEAGDVHELEVETPDPGDFAGRQARVVYLTTPELVRLVRDAWESAWYVRYDATAEERGTIPFAGFLGPFRSKEQAANRAKRLGFEVADDAPPKAKLELNVEEDVAVVQREIEALEKRYELTADDQVLLELLDHLVRSAPIPKEIRPLLQRVHEQIGVLVRDQMRRDGLHRAEDLTQYAELYARRALLEIRVRESS